MSADALFQNAPSQVLRFYVEASFLLGIILAFVVAWMSRSGKKWIGAHPREVLRLTNISVIAGLALSAARALVMPAEHLVENSLLFYVVAILGLLALARSAYAAWSLVELHLDLLGFALVHRIGRVEIRVSDKDAVAFSARLPARALVVLPSALKGSPEFQITLKHELQHHRQRDTAWLYLYEILKVLFFLNPAVHLLSRRVDELQELACDETLLGRHDISPQDYGRCLLRAMRARAHGMSMAACSGQHILRKRVDLLFRTPSLRLSRHF